MDYNLYTEEDPDMCDFNTACCLNHVPDHDSCHPYFFYRTGSLHPSGIYDPYFFLLWNLPYFTEDFQNADLHL
jgi:hypothetical protein